MSDRPAYGTCQVCTEFVPGSEMGYYDPKKWQIICRRCMKNHPSTRTKFRLVTNELTTDFIDGEDY